MGGLSSAVEDAALVLDAAGFDWILVETVGVGQDEIDIAKIAQLTIVTLVPGLGDEIQNIKAGVMEIADLFVINKADLPGCEKIKKELQAMISFVDHDQDRQPVPILETTATSGEGIKDLLDVVQRIRSDRAVSGEIPGLEISLARRRILSLAADLLMRSFLKKVPQKLFDDLVKQVSLRSIDPVSAAEKLLDRSDSLPDKC
jgi:LAO/AO transport system kinase